MNTPNFTEIQANEEGYEAGFTKQSSEVPYQMGSAEFCAWEAGYEQGRADARDVVAFGILPIKQTETDMTPTLPNAWPGLAGQPKEGNMNEAAKLLSAFKNSSSEARDAYDLIVAMGDNHASISLVLFALRAVVASATWADFSEVDSCLDAASDSMDRVYAYKEEE